jgi:hypothetical protein
MRLESPRAAGRRIRPVRRGRPRRGPGRDDDRYPARGGGKGRASRQLERSGTAIETAAMIASPGPQGPATSRAHGRSSRAAMAFEGAARADRSPLHCRCQYGKAPGVPAIGPRNRRSWRAGARAVKRRSWRLRHRLAAPANAHGVAERAPAAIRCGSASACTCGGLQVQRRSLRASGNCRTRLPVAAKMALHTAGATGGKAGSPSPVTG